MLHLQAWNNPIYIIRRPIGLGKYDIIDFSSYADQDLSSETPQDCIQVKGHCIRTWFPTCSTFNMFRIKQFFQILHNHLHWIVTILYDLWTVVYDAEYLFKDFWQKLMQWTAISSGKTTPTAFSTSIGRIVDRFEMVAISQPWIINMIQ